MQTFFLYLGVASGVIIIAVVVIISSPHPTHQPPHPSHKQPTYNQPYYAPLKADARRICAINNIISNYSYQDKYLIELRDAEFQYISDQKKLELKGISAPTYSVLGSRVC